VPGVPSAELRGRHAGAAAGRAELRISGRGNARICTDERANNLDMPNFMRALTERERNAIARYLAAL